MSTMLVTFDGLDETTQAILALAAPQGATLGRMTKVSGSWLDRQDARPGVYEALDLAHFADKSGDKATAAAFNATAMALRGPHSEALLTGDGLPMRQDRWCDCGRRTADTVEFQRWTQQGIADSGHLHADWSCRRFVPAGEVSR